MKILHKHSVKLAIRLAADHDLPKPHLFIQVYQGLIWQFEGLDGLQDSIPVAAVYVCHEALYTVHSVQRHGGLLLQGDESPVQIVFLQVLHNQTDHAVENT